MVANQLVMFKVHHKRSPTLTNKHLQGLKLYIININLILWQVTKMNLDKQQGQGWMVKNLILDSIMKQKEMKMDILDQ